MNGPLLYLFVQCNLSIQATLYSKVKKHCNIFKLSCVHLSEVCVHAYHGYDNEQTAKKLCWLIIILIIFYTFFHYSTCSVQMYMFVRTCIYVHVLLKPQDANSKKQNTCTVHVIWYMYIIWRQQATVTKAKEQLM